MSNIHTDHHQHPGTQSDAEISFYARRAQAIEALLVEKGVCTPEEVQSKADELEARSPSDGARVVARAWTDPQFKDRLLKNPHSAVAELGYVLPDTTPRIEVLENTDQVHHLVVCTLCSCYPRDLLGRPPDWYKSLPYRSRAVVDPRGVIREFGLAIDASIEVRVLDSTADRRYLVLPPRPDGTEGLGEEQLAELVTRDSMIGAGTPKAPAGVAQ